MWLLCGYSGLLWGFVAPYFQKNPNSPENFVKLYGVFQKLDHLTCNKLKLRRPSINPLS